MKSRSCMVKKLNLQVLIINRLKETKTLFLTHYSINSESLQTFESWLLSYQ